MYVERQFIEVKQRRVGIDLPESFVNHRVEVIANDDQLLPIERKFSHERFCNSLSRAP